MKRNRIKEFWESMSAYEICFCIENMALIAGILQIKDFHNFGYWCGLIAAFIGVILIIGVVVSNAYNSFESDIELSYKLEKKVILPLNVIKNSLCIIAFIFMWFILKDLRPKITFEILLTILLLVTNLKYYHTVLNIKERILDRDE